MLLKKLIPLESKLTSVSCSALVLFLRLLTLPRDTDELKIAKAAHQNCVPASALDDQLKKREDSHKVALQKERDEISRMKLELEQSRNEKAEVERAMTKERQLRTARRSKWQLGDYSRALRFGAPRI